MHRLRALTLTCLLGLAFVACQRAPEGPRVLEVRPVDPPSSVPRPAALLTLPPAATPTFPTLELHSPETIDIQRSSGWNEDDPAPGFRRQGTVRFWIGAPRPLRLRARVRVIRKREPTTARLGVGIGSQGLGEIEVSAEPANVSFDIPPEALVPGTNMLFLWRSGRGRMTFEELVLEDREAPRHDAVRHVELVLDGAASQRGVEVDREGPLSFLVHLPRCPLHLDVGLSCQGGTPRAAPRFRVTAEADRHRKVIAEGDVDHGHIRWHRLSLADFAGEPTRLSLEVTRLPEGERCVWVEPRIVDTHPDREGPADVELRAPRANIIVIVLDAATRDRFGVYGSKAGTTPVIDALAEESLVLDRAVAQASYTLASTASLFTGHLPPAHQVTSSTFRETPALPASLPTFAEVLDEAGYVTAMFTGNPHTLRYGLSRGFQEVHEIFRGRRDGVARATDFARPLRDWITGPPREPYFLYVHYVQPHEPYDVAPGSFYGELTPGYEGAFDGSRTSLLPLFRGEAQPEAADVRHLQDLYNGNLRYADWGLGELLGELREQGALEDSLLVVTADHGESLGERGAFGHGTNVHRETVPIPLLIRFPARFQLAGRRQVPLGNADLLPTLLDFVGVPAPEGTWGQSRLSQLADPSSRDWPRPLPAWAGSPRAANVAVFGAGFKYTFNDRTNHESLLTFEEQEDGPDVRSGRPVTFDYLAFASFGPGIERAQVEPGEAEGVDAETLEALRALGYVE